MSSISSSPPEKATGGGDVGLTIELDTAAVSRLLGALPKEIERATRDALNETARHVRSEVSKEIRATWQIKKADVDKYIAISSATATKPEARVRMTGDPIPLSKFGARQTRRGASVALRRGGGRTLLRGAFMATMESGHTGVFRRVSKSRRGGKPYRSLPVRTVKSGRWSGTTYRPALPIRELKSIRLTSIWGRFINRSAVDAGQFAARRFQGRLQSLIERRK